MCAGPLLHAESLEGSVDSAQGVESAGLSTNARKPPQHQEIGSTINHAGLCSSLGLIDTSVSPDSNQTDSGTGFHGEERA